MSEIRYGIPPMERMPVQMPEGSAPVLEGMQDAYLEPVITQEDIRKATETLKKYKAGKAQLEERIVQDENWYMMRNWEEQKLATANPNYKLQTKSAWLFNAINNAHTDAMNAYPRPNVLPREQGDMEEAGKLSKILPVVMEYNDFKETYNRVQWKKCISGTGAYGVFWDPDKSNGLGDISIERVDILTLYWEPGVQDIQDSRHVFCVKMFDRETLREMYPELEEQSLNSADVKPKEYQDEDKSSNKDDVAVIDWYYHRYHGKQKVLHLCKYVGDTILYASENMPEFQESGYYQHGNFPFVLDAMYPMENSPAGFGMIDINKNTQEQIDLLNSAITENTIAASNLRFMYNPETGLNPEVLRDPTQRAIAVEGPMGDEYIRQFSVDALPAITVQILNNKIEELKQTSGNQDVANGVSTGGATAYSAIKTLVETAGKNMKGANYGAYRAYRKIIIMVIELIRQFYEVPRFFRITGEMGEREFVPYSNEGLKPQPMLPIAGYDTGMRNPVFDIEVSAEQESEYTKMAQNEDAIRLQSLGVFNPQMADQSLMLLEMMDFRGKDELMRKVKEMGVQAKLLQYFMQVAMTLAARYEPQTAQVLMQQMQQVQAEGSAGLPQRGAPGAPKAMADGQVAHNMDAPEKQKITRDSRIEKSVADTTKPE